MQGVILLVDLHVLDVHEPDVIFGVAWLESLEKVAEDFVGKTLELRKDD